MVELCYDERALNLVGCLELMMIVATLVIAYFVYNPVAATPNRTLENDVIYWDWNLSFVRAQERHG